MTVHRITMPDAFAGDEPREIVWDDETGEVSGDHSDVPDIGGRLDSAARDGFLPAMCGHWDLRDPRHDAEDFLVVLFWPGSVRAELLPPALRVKPAPFIRAADIPDGAVA